ncbi:Abscisic acid 8'-hydroxylase 4 [Madurella fahalii]|uniref:Abscisic acid 8'-hydroxylase 4 n=1 Tax=Madurella fahalii TaxID=1157608 RepID=A0ABQ0GBX8_9PEZI
MESSYVRGVITLIVHDGRLALLAAALFSLLLWRFYTFTVAPWLHPTDPKEYPYWVPVVGHLRSFFKNSSRLVSEARLFFHGTGEPFTLTVAGQKWYVLTKAEHVAATYKMEHLSYDIFAVEVMRMIGVSEDGISKAFQTHHVAKDGSKSPPYKHLVRLCKEYQLEQLSPGNRLDQLVGRSTALMRRHLEMESILNRGRHWYASPTGPGGDCVTVSLYQWISDVFIDMGTQAYFGRLLQEIEPDLIRTFMAFETLSWQAMYQYPSFLCKEMMDAKAKLQHAMEVYFYRTPKSQRADASWFISRIEEETSRLQVAPADSAIFFFQLFWSINGNTRKAPFWIFSYLLCGNQHLVDIIRTETAPAMHEDGTVDVAYLINDQTCPRLNSVWDETVRLTAFAASVRFLTHDVELGGKTLRKGNRLMMPQRQLHFNTQAFGETAAQFDPDRFWNDPSLRRNPSLRPFGGGATMCPGRNLAKQTTLAFVTKVVHDFDISLDPPNQKFPEPAEGKPSIGLVDVQEGHDLRVRLCPRKARQ